MDIRSVQQIGVLDPWLGGGGIVILGFLPCLLLICIGCNNTLCPFQVITDYETRVGQGHAALFPRVGAETGATDLFGLGQVSDLLPLGACWRIAGAGGY